MKSVLCHISVQSLRFFEKHAQNLNTSQNNSASRDLQMGFNSAFKGLSKIAKSSYSLPHVCPTARNSVPTGRIVMKYEI